MKSIGSRRLVRCGPLLQFFHCTHLAELATTSSTGSFEVDISPTFYKIIIDMNVGFREVYTIHTELKSVNYHFKKQLTSCNSCNSCINSSSSATSPIGAEIASLSSPEIANPSAISSIKSCTLSISILACSFFKVSFVFPRTSMTSLCIPTFSRAPR
ncbi:hypothetical protein GCK72_006168 [Caenorhabditis remanei]|uniref:Uncharacterized protein n=1 Tax=Caenorhabditis remanei TaxID=31234 RepID=A0A6A5HJY8_CAERE|nr:hypothetical protein GCK72_006168 [Caenorhabditis remanei]KAF1766212.1 hypothetical protein GCK72_006168 [Caenorhabditis remanei]